MINKKYYEKGVRLLHKRFPDTATYAFQVALLDENEILRAKLEELGTEYAIVCHYKDERDAASEKLAASEAREIGLRGALREVVVNLAQVEAVTRHQGMTSVADEVRSYRHELSEALSTTEPPALLRVLKEVLDEAERVQLSLAEDGRNPVYLEKSLASLRAAIGGGG